MISRWTVLDPPLGTTIAYISPNWSDGGMLTILQDAVSIDCTVDDNIYDKWLGVVA